MAAAQTDGRARTQQDGRELLASLLKDLGDDEAVIREIIEEARVHSPDVAKLSVEENRRHVTVMLRAGLAALLGGERVEVGDFSDAARLGAHRAAQGISITALLRGVHAGRGRITEIAIDRARAAGVPAEVTLEALVAVNKYAGMLERHVISGYHSAELELAWTARDTRQQVLRQIMCGEELSGEDLVRGGLQPQGLYHWVLSDVTDLSRARSLEQRLAHDLGVYGFVDGRLAGLVSRLPDRDAVGGEVLMVASPPVPLGQVSELHPLVGSALETGRRLGLHGVHEMARLAGQTALFAQPALAELLVHSLLGELNPEDEFHRQLASTALAYLDHGHRVDHAATALHVHPNTVRYRLGRLSEITGAPLDPTASGSRPAVVEAMRWWWALHTWLEGAVRRA
ncbi:helix-turn-helix domain-containing protein [Streptomyces sp. NA04227]|uniref:helix-turn-helix domain-containing protein n=1 Tax=Streptomyces sp. NA04227 TaxID=2742136 RepID=UPI0015918E53|nr:PucR family transcriptional regulator [Streptomyces sp. NA04227]QKW09040.1 helix-turn-helix domain-containing protein [Streptomyces sp. NA04227]